MVSKGFLNVVTSGQQYNIREKPAVILSLDNQADSGACLFTGPPSPVFRDGVYLYRQPPSDQSRVNQVTHMRTAINIIAFTPESPPAAPGQ